MATQTKTDSGAKVAAREQLEQITEPRDQTSTLEEQAEQQEKTQADLLKAGSQGEAKDGPTVAHNRTAAGKQSTGVQNGFIDQMTRRDPSSDVMEGHNCQVDLNAKGVNTDLFPAGWDGYGVYVEPATTDKDGYPTTARVLARNTTQSVVVPYEALSPAAPRGR